MLIASVRTGDLTSAPPNIAEPNRDTHVAKKSFMPWLRGLGEYDFLVDGLSDAKDTSVPATSGTVIVWTPERKDDARAMLEREKHQGVRDYAAKTAEAFGVSPARLRQVLGDKAPKKSKAKPTGFWEK